MRRFKYVFLALTLTVMMANISFAQDTQFHPAQTEAEKALDGIMHRNYDAANIYSKSFLAFISEFKEKEKSGECKTPITDIRNILCDGIKHLPTGYAREFDEYMFKTTYKDNERAVIEIIPKEFLEHYPNSTSDIYNFTKEDNNWKLDGVDYGGIFKYNISIDNILTKIHLPETETEKVLDKILKLNNSREHDVYSYVFRQPYIEFKEDEILKPLFTDNLIKESSKEEYDLIKESCGGIMPEDKRPCDMYREVNPISCAQDTPENYIYKTIKSTDTEAFVQYVWPNSEFLLGPIYKFIKEQNIWKLDKACLKINDIN